MICFNKLAEGHFSNILGFMMGKFKKSTHIIKKFVKINNILLKYFYPFL